MRRMLIAILSVLVAIFAANTAFAGKKAKADKETVQWRYEMETVGENRTTGHVLKIWSYSKKPVIAEEQSKKNAVHAVIFKGVPANDAKRLHGIKALVQDPQAEEANKAFFDDFFKDGGDYMRFVVLSNSGMADIIKYGKEYKVGLTVTVNTPALRKYLEQKGIIAALNRGFN